MPDRKAPPRKRVGEPTTESTTPDKRPAPTEPESPGYVGTLPDDTPNEDYTLAGQVRLLNT